MKYSTMPLNIGFRDIRPKEVFYFLYLPISLAGSRIVAIPPQLKIFSDLIDMVAADEPKRFVAENVYITAKRMFVGPNQTANRPGYHADGFLTNDLNYVWYDCLPTIFNKGEFNVTEDHVKSLLEFEQQAKVENEVEFEPFNLLKLDSSCVHRVKEAAEVMMRTFVKISISPDRYNLKDNSVNYDLDYNWSMFDRAAVRNNPNLHQRDSVPVGALDDHFI